VKGRGASSNPSPRFERLRVVSEVDLAQERFDPESATHYLIDRTRNVISFNSSPDLPFDASVNPYRGCAHGCPYCYARPTHEYLGFSAGLEFETRIMVKPDAPQLLCSELSSKAWRPRVLVLSGVTDAYQPIERSLRLTSRCLEVLAQHENPVGIVTKNHLVTRDIDLLLKLSSKGGVRVDLSITTLDNRLAAKMEPRASSPRARLDAIRELSSAGVCAGVSLAPVIPGLNDREIPQILQAVRDAGGRFAGFGLLRLPGVVGEIFDGWLAENLPERHKKILHQLSQSRGGNVDERRFFHRFKGQGPYFEAIRSMFETHRSRLGLAPGPRLRTPTGQKATKAESGPAPSTQMRLFA
jgi:DNA repair photolyase